LQKKSHSHYHLFTESGGRLNPVQWFSGHNWNETAESNIQAMVTSAEKNETPLEVLIQKNIFVKK